MIKTTLPFICSIVLLQACSSPPTRVNYYDFGAVSQMQNQQPSCNLPPIYLAYISVPSIFAGDEIHYRLLYSNELESRTYANYRWSMLPSELIAQRIRMQLEQAGVEFVDDGTNNSAALELRLALEDFTQYFSNPSHNYAQIKLRASLVRGPNTLAQTSFTQQANADAPDAPAGVRAMRAATDELIGRLGDWGCGLRMTEGR